MGNSASVQEKIVAHAERGEYYPLRALLDQLAQSSEVFRRSPGQFLDVQNGEGSTPLIIACQKGNYQIAELLIQRGASLLYQNRRADGGSALHEAIYRRYVHVANLLLSSNANPFVENIKNCTPLDFACEARNLALMRRIEDMAPWKGWLEQKVSSLAGLRSQWQRRWVVICYRISSPFAPPERRRTHVSLLCYLDQERPFPACKTWLDGARAVEVSNPRALEHSHGLTPAQAEVRLHPRHREPSGCYSTGGGSEGYILHFRPDEGSLAGCTNLVRFMETVNTRRPPTTALVMGPAAIPAGPLTPGGHAPPSPAQAQADPAYSPMGQAVVTGVSVDADAELARRLQAEEDAALAHQMASSGNVNDDTRNNVVTCGRPSSNQTPLSISAAYPAIQLADEAGGTVVSGPVVRPPAGVITAPEPPISSAGTPPRPRPPPRTAAAPQEQADDGTCVICMDEAAIWVLVHGEISHKAMCNDCKVNWQQQLKRDWCPVCKQKIERFTRVA